MDWTQTLTIIGTIIPAIAAFYYIIREDIKRHDVEIKEQRKEYMQEFSEMRKEFSKRDSLWAQLLQEIHAIKLDQAKKSSR